MKRLFITIGIIGGFVINCHAALISRTYTYTAGNTMTANENNTNENTIYTEINGNLNNANILDGGVATADLADGLITKAKLGNGSLSASNVVIKTSTYTVLITDDLLVSSAPLTTNSFTYTLPTAVGNSGKVFYFTLAHQNTAIGGVVTIDGNGSETVGGSLTRTMNTPNESYTIVSDGTNWQVISHKANTPWVSYTPTFSAGWGTASAITVYWRRVGDSIEIRGTFTAGTVQASAGSITLPSGLTIDSAKIAAGQTAAAGLLYDLSGAGAGTFTAGRALDLFYDGSNTDRFFMGNQTGAGVFSATNVSSGFSNSDVVSFHVHSLPISNWNE